MAAVRVALLCGSMLVVLALAPTGITGQCSDLRQRIPGHCVKYCGVLLDDCDKCMGKRMCVSEAVARVNSCFVNCSRCAITCTLARPTCTLRCVNDALACFTCQQQACSPDCVTPANISPANILDPCKNSCSAQESVCNNKCNANA